MFMHLVKSRSHGLCTAQAMLFGESLLNVFYVWFAIHTSRISDLEGLTRNNFQVFTYTMITRLRLII